MDCARVFDSVRNKCGSRLDFPAGRLSGGRDGKCVGRDVCNNRDLQLSHFSDYEQMKTFFSLSLKLMLIFAVAWLATSVMVLSLTFMTGDPVMLLWPVIWAVWSVLLVVVPWVFSFCSTVSLGFASVGLRPRFAREAPNNPIRGSLIPAHAGISHKR